MPEFVVLAEEEMDLCVSDVFVFVFCTTCVTAFCQCLLKIA